MIDNATGRAATLHGTEQRNLDADTADDLRVTLSHLYQLHGKAEGREEQAWVRYGAIPAVERHAQSLELQRIKSSDRERWANPLNLASSWNPRARAAAGLIEPPAVVIDIGCGAMALEEELAAGVTYMPADIVARDDRTFVFDINANELPVAEADVAVALGFLEYVHDPAAFFTAAHARWPRLLLSYNAADLDLGRDRRAHGWFNDLTSAQLIAIAIDAGFEVGAILPFDARQRIYDFRRSA